MALHLRKLPAFPFRVCLLALVVGLISSPYPSSSVIAQSPVKVVGNGSPQSCTAAALAEAVVGGGEIRFNCGAAPHTITLPEPLVVNEPQTMIDGDGLITLQGDGGRIIDHFTIGFIGASRLELRNLTISGGRASGGGSDTAAVNGSGGAIRSFFAAANPAFTPTLVIDRVIFRDNQSTLTSVPAGRDAYDYGGGAIYSRGGAVEITNSRFEGNHAHNGAGGAIHLLQSSLLVEDTVFVGNTAIGARPQDSLGGAISADGLGGANRRLRVVRCLFQDNQTYNSGGAIHANMYEDSSGLEVIDSSFINNAVIGGSRGQGGAIGGGGTASGPGTGNPVVIISGSFFQANRARRTPNVNGNPHADGSGGAIAFPQQVALRIVNTTFVANQAEGSSFNANGGALYILNNRPEPFVIESSTFAYNEAGWVGGAISHSGNGSVSNTLFAYNTAGNGGQGWNIQQHCSKELTHDGRSLQYPPRLTGANFWNDVTCFAGKSSPAQTGDPQFRDPLLQSPVGNGGPTFTMAIPAESPARDTGSACPPTDQRGVTRPQLNGCDLGAFELQLSLIAFPPLFARQQVPPPLLIYGVDFTDATQVLINGQPRSTTFIDNRRLRVTLTLADVNNSGPVTVGLSGPGSALGSTQIRVVDAVYHLYNPLVVRP
ncbi:choice-of-anchor Q domain-containing protein [Chloroflexus sp.]|uniref:choice-of-anchor Q domain-containing protein n=1 Tax=Chloroflexus sp. TaxID=1904827 RepID=UPI002604FD33|nr:choice-of-anchor Q domain-containing protein [uncultured Chloroflexus sp.]